MNVDSQRQGPHPLALVALLLLAAAAASSCAPRRFVVGEMAAVAAGGVSAFENESDLDLLEDAMPAGIKLLEAVLASDPANRELLLLLARLYGGYAFAFTEGELDALRLTPKDGDAREKRLGEALNRYYSRGAEYALRALETRHPHCRRQLSRPADLPALMARLTPRDQPALFWYGFNLGAYVNQNRDSLAAIARAHAVEKAMQRSIELDEAYYHGCAHLLLMAYYASRPPMMGGDPQRALHHHRRLKGIAGDGFLLGDVFYARYCLYRARDRRAFEMVLERVAAHPPESGAYPFLNAVAARRAQTYLDAADRLFD